MQRHTYRVSAVVPVLNEAAQISSCLAHLSELPGVDEILVVDGNSTDGTCDLVSDFDNINLLHSDRGRAQQLNFGAGAASGEVLLFAHADVRLPLDAVAWIHWALSDDDVVAGAFRTHTVADVESPPWWSPLLRLADIRSRFRQRPYGDQAIFVRRAAFDAVGGFPETAILEDVGLGRRLARLGTTRTVPATVTVSGRRFLARPAYYTLSMYLIPLLYRLGAPSGWLKKRYGDVR